MPKPLLITGASGLVGWQICDIARPSQPVYGVVHQQSTLPIGVEPVPLDLTDSPRVQSVLRQLRPGAVIHAAAITSIAECHQHPGRSHALNVEATRALAQICQEMRLPLVFTSTDLVFDGLSAPYAENDPTTPVNAYGQQKAEAEHVLQMAYPQATVCRLPLLYGPPAAAWHTQNFTVATLCRLKQGQPVTLFSDEYRTPVDTLSAAKGLLWALGHPGQVLHLGGKQRVSRAQIGLLAADLLKVDPGLINCVARPQTTNGQPRASDVSLDSRLAFDLGYAPLDLENGLRETLRHLPTITQPGSEGTSDAQQT